MASFFTFGEEPNTVPEILDIMSRSPGLHLLFSKWENIAALLGVRECITMLKQKYPLRLRVANLEGLLLDLLNIWKDKRGNMGKFEEFYLVLSLCNANEVADNLNIELSRKLKEKLVGTDGTFTPGNVMKMSEIFILPPAVISRPKRNNPMVVLSHLQLQEKLITSEFVGRAFERLVGEISDAELKILQGFSFKKLSLDNLAYRIGVQCSVDHLEALKIIDKMELANYGRSLLLWFVAARSILNSWPDNCWVLEKVLVEVFQFEEEEDYEDTTAVPRFRNELLVFFIDFLLGLGTERGFKGFDVRKMMVGKWPKKYAIACQESRGYNLIKHLCMQPLIAHKLVWGSMSLNGSQLEAVKRTVQMIVQKDPECLDRPDEDHVPLLFLNHAHVDLIKLIISSGVSVQMVDQEGRNIVHHGAENLDAGQFQELVRYVIELEQPHLLIAKDNRDQTPLSQSPKLFTMKADVSTIQHFISAGADFNITDRSGLNCMYYAVTRNKSVGVLQALVAGGADLNWRDCTSGSYLHLAAEQGNLETVQYLVGQGCNVNALDNNGRTPLQYIFAIGKDDEDVVSFLLEHGAR